MAIRINKFLAFRGVGARRKCDLLIADGRVSVNGRVVREPGTMIEERDKVAVDGRLVGGRERHVYYVLNKPVGVITTLDDPQGRRTIREFLPRGARVYPVGRLDADTSGLLLLTNDGELAHRLMHPRYGVPKVYRVRLGREPRPDQLRRLSSGVRFDQEQVSGPARVRRIDPGFDAIMIEVTIHEGRFRQVRKMCEAVGLEVTGLHRVGYGPLRLGPMTRGMFRELSDEEVARLRAASSRPGGTRSPGREGTAAKRVRAPEPPPMEERGEEDEEDEATWVPGGGLLPRDEDDTPPPTREPAGTTWPARAGGRRGDRDFRGSEARPARAERPRTERPRTERPVRDRDRGPRGLRAERVERSTRRPGERRDRPAERRGRPGGPRPSARLSDRSRATSGSQRGRAQGPRGPRRGTGGGPGRSTGRGPGAGPGPRRGPGRGSSLSGGRSARKPSRGKRR